ncbi:MAG: hypothetical protein COY02_04310, partial [Parcubacteria group bacterium CG_4_10_14_0_2_um_filter_41_6]
EDSINRIQGKLDGNVSVRKISISDNEEAKKIYMKLVEKVGETIYAVPFIYVNGKYVMGWNQYNQSEKETLLESYIVN